MTGGDVATEDLARTVDAARIAKGLTWAALAEAIDRPPVWTVAALQGQHPLDAGAAQRIGETLGLDEEVVAELQRFPTRGALGGPVPVDPTIYRFYEVLQVYGPAIKALIHEEFGDGIMSAINFSLDLERVPDPGGDRVKVTLEGKFLPYQWGP
jgi:cyanate lyase